MDDLPGEAGELTIYRRGLARRHRLERTSMACLYRRTSIRRSPRAARARVPRGVEVFTMYDDAGDSLLHVFPGHGRSSMRCRSRRTPAVAVAGGCIDFEFSALPSRIAERYALIVNYHYCHPPDGFLKGTKAVTPEEFDLSAPCADAEFRLHDDRRADESGRRLPETVAVVTFDDGFKESWSTRCRCCSGGGCRQRCTAVRRRCSKARC